MKETRQFLANTIKDGIIYAVLTGDIFLIILALSKKNLYKLTFAQADEYCQNSQVYYSKTFLM